MAPAKTGNDSKSKKDVTKTAQTNKGNLLKGSFHTDIFNIVVIKLIEPNNDEAPAKCRLKIAQSTAGPE